MGLNFMHEIEVFTTSAAKHTSYNIHILLFFILELETLAAQSLANIFSKSLYLPANRPIQRQIEN